MNDESMTGETLVKSLQGIVAEQRARIVQLYNQIADLERHNRELREAVDALLRPAPSELLAKNMAHPSRT